MPCLHLNSCADCKQIVIGRAALVLVPDDLKVLVLVEQGKCDHLDSCAECTEFGESFLEYVKTDDEIALKKAVKIIVSLTQKIQNLEAQIRTLRRHSA